MAEEVPIVIGHRKRDTLANLKLILEDGELGTTSAGAALLKKYGTAEYLALHQANQHDADGYESFSAAVSAIGGTDLATLVVSSPQDISANVTVTPNISIVVANGGYFSIATGCTLTINGSFSAEQYTCFVCAGTGAVTFGVGAVREVLPQWWGGEPNSAADQTAIVLAATKAAGRTPVRFTRGEWRVVGLDLSSYPCTWIGDTVGETYIVLHSDTADMITIAPASESIHWHFKNLQFVAWPPFSTNYSAFKMTRVALSSWEGCHFGGLGSGLRFFQNCSTSQIINCVFGSNNQIGIRFDSSGTNTDISIVGCFFDENLNRSIYCNSAGVLISGCIFDSSASEHILLDAAATEVTIAGNHFRQGGGPSTPTAITIYGNKNTITNNYFDDHAGYEVVVQAGATDNVVALNHAPASYISDAGTRTAKSLVRAGRFIWGTAGDDGTTPHQFTGNATFTAGVTAGQLRQTNLTAKSIIYAGTDTDLKQANSDFNYDDSLRRILVAALYAGRAPTLTTALLIGNSSLDHSSNIYSAALVQTSAGRTILNAASGQQLDLNIGGSGIIQMVAGTADVYADVKIQTAGKGVSIKEGSNARMGVATLSGGAVTVNNTSITANTRIFLTVQSLGTVVTPKTVSVTARTASTSFTITSEDATDTSVVAWMLLEPA